MQCTIRSMEEKKRKFNPHLIFVFALLALLIAAGIRIYLWNQGQDSGYDRNAPVTTEFDTEPLDIFFKLTPDKLEGRPDDGKHTILFLGNNAITDGHDPDQVGTMTELLEQRYDVSTINGGFHGSLMSCDSSVYIPTCPWDAFRLYHLSKALCTGDFKLQEEALESDEMEFPENQENEYRDKVALLKDLDMNTVDTLVIFYDGADMLNYRPVREVEGEISKDISTVCGALSSSLDLLQKAYPFIRIVIMSPFHAYAVSEQGFYESLDTLDYGQGSLPDYLYSMVDVARDHDVSMIDNYYGTINELSGTSYLEDNMKLNNDGRDVLTERLAAFLGLHKKDQPS